MISDIKGVDDFLAHKSIAKLSGLNKIFIKKSVVQVSSCDKYNVFGIHEIESDTEYNTQAIFYIVEYSDFCNRQFCSGDCRQFKLLASDQQIQEKNEFFKENVFLEFDRPQKCTFC